MSALLLPTRLLLARVGCSGTDTGESGRFLGVNPTTDAAPGQALAGVGGDGRGHAPLSLSRSRR